MHSILYIFIFCLFIALFLRLKCDCMNVCECMSVRVNVCTPSVCDKIMLGVFYSHFCIWISKLRRVWIQFYGYMVYYSHSYLNSTCIPCTLRKVQYNRLVQGNVYKQRQCYYEFPQKSLHIYIMWLSSGITWPLSRAGNFS